VIHNEQCKRDNQFKRLDNPTLQVYKRLDTHLSLDTWTIHFYNLIQLQSIPFVFYKYSKFMV